MTAAKRVFDKMPQRDLVLGILWLWVRIEMYDIEIVLFL